MKTDDVFKKNWEECLVFVEQISALFIVMLWNLKDIANILTNTCFPCCFFFAGERFVLLYIKLSAD